MNYLAKGFYNLIHTFNLQNPQLFLKTLFNYSTSYLRFPILPLPIEIQLEPSSRCNLKCTICNLKTYHSKHHFLSPTELEKIIRQLKPLKNVNLTGMGESLLNPHFTELLQVLCQNHVPFTFITNALLLSQSYTKKILPYHPKAIIVSVDSALKSNYEHIRVGASFPRLVTNLKHLARLRKQISPNTQLIINATIIPFHPQALVNAKSVIRLAKQLKFDLVTFQTILNSHSNPQLHLSKTLPLYQNISLYAQKINQSIVLPGINPKINSCYYPWIYPQVTAGGDLLPCCLVPQSGDYQEIIKKYSWGNLFRQSFRSCWNSPKAQQFRNQLNSANPPTPCQLCPKYRGLL
jgi:MoaA/NifB/PqqE/SkfB family radical SAM enzyme